MKEITQLIRQLSDRGFLPLLDTLAPSWQDIYLVGGSLRDWFLHRPLHDFDFATAGDPTELAQAFARAVGGHWISLDESFCQSRVVLNAGDEHLQCDFAPLRAATLAQDLAARDFTLNAIALDLRNPERGVIDPLDGARSITQKEIRSCSAEVLNHDPLRVLRGVRFSAQLDMTIDVRTWAEMRMAALQLDTVAGERLQQELVLILAKPDGGQAWARLTELGVWQECGLSLIEPCRGHNALEQADSLLADVSRNGAERFSILLGLPVGNGWSRLALVRLAIGLAHTVDPQGLDNLAERLRWGRRLRNLIKALCATRDRYPLSGVALPITPRGRLHHILGLSSDPLVSSLFAWLQSQDGAPVPEQILSLADDLSRHAPTGKLPPLVDGKWLTRELGIEPGPDVGRLLVAVHAAEAAGEVAGREQAEDYLRNLMNKPLTS